MISKFLEGVTAAENGGAVIKRLQGVRILFVEDDPLIATTIFLMLHQAGAHVVAAREYSLGMSHLKFSNSRFDVLLCDYDLGAAKTGLDFIQEARLYCHHPIACVLISGSLDGSFFDDKDTPLVEKPFQAEELIRRIERQLVQVKSAMSRHRRLGS